MKWKRKDLLMKYKNLENLKKLPILNKLNAISAV